MAQDPIGVELAGGVLTLTLQRPERRNALDRRTTVRLTELLREANPGSTVRAVLVTGSHGDFCTGGDLAEAPEAGGESPPAPSMMDYRYFLDDHRELFKTLWELEKPAVSAVNGTVVGIGRMLALLCDLVVASDEARWIHAFTRRAYVPHGGDPFFMPRLIGLHRLAEVAMLGEPVSSATMHDWGLVNRLVPSDQVVPVAQELATRLAAGPTRSLGQTKRLYRRSLVSDMATSFADEAATTAMLLSTHDRAEGVASFLERRPAEFTGE